MRVSSQSSKVLFLYFVSYFIFLSFFLSLSNAPIYVFVFLYLFFVCLAFIVSYISYIYRNCCGKNRWNRSGRPHEKYNNDHCNLLSIVNMPVVLLQLLMEYIDIRVSFLGLSNSSRFVK